MRKLFDKKYTDEFDFLKVDDNFEQMLIDNVFGNYTYYVTKESMNNENYRVVIDNKFQLFKTKTKDEGDLTYHKI